MQKLYCVGTGGWRVRIATGRPRLNVSFHHTLHLNQPEANLRHY